jgi:UDP-glucose 4-epimerase
MSKVVVFGGSGFLGSHVSDELTKRGHEVIIFDRVKSQYLHDTQKMIVGDMMDRDLVRKAIEGVDYVYHFAAMADIHEARENPVEAANFNIMGTMFVLDACREFNVKRFVYSSTIYVYSNHGSFYRSSKQACELFIENYNKEYNLDFTILRYGSLYGPRANSFNFIRNVIHEALLEKRIQRKGDGNEVRDYINVLDAATASVDVLSEEYKNSYVMITGPQTMKVKEILEMIKEILNDEIEIEYQNGNFEGHYQITPYSFKPKVALKLIPKNYHDLGQGILDCIYDIYQEMIEEGRPIKYNFNNNEL